jgi:hypothetical protein
MVSSGEEEDDWQRFFEIEYELIRNVPIFAAIGNHEEHDGDADLYLKYFAPPQQSSGREEFYAFTYGNTRFIVMDTHVKTILGGPDFEQGGWLDEELGADDPAIEHKFIVLHHGPYSSKPGRSGNLGVNVFWMDKFLDAGVDMVLSGHDHYYERGEDQRGMRYAIVGGGGAPLYDTDGPGNRGGREIFVSDSILSYVTMTIFGGRVEGCAKDTAGVVIECFSWGEGAIPDEPGPEPDPVPDPTPDPAAEPDPSPDGDPEQVECLDNVDCQGRDDMAHCAGMWVCIGQACGWSCDQVAPDPDPTPDAQPDVDPGEEPQPGPDADPGDGKDPGEDPGIGGEEDDLVGGDPGTFGGQRDGDVGPRIDDVPSKGSGSSDCSTAAGSWAAALRGLVRR